MKTLDIPKSGKCGVIVAYRTRFGSHQRSYVIPKNRQTQARQHMRSALGRLSNAWGTVLTQAQREAWNAKAPAVQSRKRLGQSGPLFGQMHFVGINSARARIGRDPLWTPPEPVTFAPNPVGPLTITNTDTGPRLLLEVTAPLTEDIMVFGQAPCSAGRSKRRNVSYLGLLPAPVDGVSDITALYVARYGGLPSGQRIFIVTRQQRDGWESRDQETNEIIPRDPAGQVASAEPALTLKPIMHKGCTRDAQGSNTPATGSPQASQKPETTSQNAPSPASDPSATSATSDPVRGGDTPVAGFSADGLRNAPSAPPN